MRSQIDSSDAISARPNQRAANAQTLVMPFPLSVRLAQESRDRGASRHEKTTSHRHARIPTAVFTWQESSAFPGGYRGTPSPSPDKLSAGAGPVNPGNAAAHRGLLRAMHVARK